MLFRESLMFLVSTEEKTMSNAEFGAYQEMLRQCEESMFGGDVQDDETNDEECE
jgi:hypothetical protein